MAKPRFSNDVVVRWLPDGRNMRVTYSLSFHDAKGKKWWVPEGSLIDGASIPKFFWRMIGSPFVGKYRRASVIHDVHCRNKNFPHKAVHKMFHEAMLCDGVSKTKAWTMYQAVARFGPKWKVKNVK